MKGVKINNYIDNRIVLSSRKLKNEVQTLIQSNRPRPLVIRHVNYFEEEEDGPVNTEEKDTLKAIQSKSQKKIRRKVKHTTAIIGDINHHSNQKVEKKERVKKQSGKKISPAKKRSSESSPSGQSQTNFNSTHKKLRSASKNGEGLGKRSKSAIIKRHKSPTNAAVEQDKKKTDASMKINLNLKKEGQAVKKKKTKKEKKNTSGTKGKDLKKNVSSLNISEKKTRADKQGTKTSRQPSKSVISSITQSKPVSARENKKKYSNTIKNLFGSAQKKPEVEHITFEDLLNIQNKDFKIKSAMMKLQDAINSKGSRKKLSEKLELLAEKLKQINNQQQDAESEEEQDDHSVHSNQKEDNNEEIKEFLSNFQHDQAPKYETKGGEFTNPLIVKNLNEPQKEEAKSNLDIAQEYILVEDIKKEEPALPKQIEAKRENYIKNPDNKRDDLQRQNGVYSRNQDETNPLIGRKTGGDSYLDLVDYDSINSVKSNQDQKSKQINQLKKFQQESDLMMKRIKQFENKKKAQEPLPAPIKPPEQSSLPPKPTGQASPKSLQIKSYTTDKYPTMESIRSPKFSAQQIIQVIKLKERVQTDRHEKLSELVNVMFDKKIVSPKTYSVQIQTLREQLTQNNQVLDGYKRHAEELASLLSEIKKEKEEISSIDEMIRSQKWKQAIHVIKQNEKSAKKPQNKRENPDVRQFSAQQLEDQNAQAVYYSGQDSQLSDTGIKLIQIQNDEEPKEPLEPSLSASNVIKIDETNHKVQKKQKGFDSNLFFIKEYCIALCQFVRDHHKQSFRKRIGEPMSYDLPKLLQSFRINRDGSLPFSINSLFEDLAYHGSEFHHNIEPISIEIFEEFNKQYGSIKYYHKQQSQDATLEGIFLKSIYDALNQSIMIEKPGSMNGKALPWASNSKHLKNLKNSLKNSQEQKFKNQQSQDLIFGISIARIIQWGSCLCGFIPDTVQLQNTEIDEQYINHIRQTRTALLLQKMLAEQQATMYRTELEETQVKLCLGQLVGEEIIKEMAQDMRKIVLRSLLRGVDY